MSALSLTVPFHFFLAPDELTVEHYEVREKAAAAYPEWGRSRWMADAREVTGRFWGCEYKRDVATVVRRRL